MRGNPINQPVHLEVFYPYPPERVWQVLVDRRALAAWMMENNFEPKLGHKFQFYSQLLPGLTTTIQCEVVELEEPTRLVYTWQESSTAEPSLVIWTLTSVTGGTQLRLKHHQYSYTTAKATSSGRSAINMKHNFGESTHFDYNSGLFQAEKSSCTRLDPSCHSALQHQTQSNPSGRSTTLELPQFQTFTWDYFLNQTLLQVLGQDESTGK